MQAEIDALPDWSLLLEDGRWLVALAHADEVPRIVSEIGRLREIAFRAQHGYPPWRPLWRLLWITDLADAPALAAATAYADALRSATDRLGLPYTDVLGPAPAFFHRLRGRYRWQILLSSPDGYALLAAAPPPAGWRVDVDAVDVL